MNLFSETNLLPYDGSVTYIPHAIAQAEEVCEQLLAEISWSADEVMMFGKLIRTKRKIAWFSEQTSTYTYSGKTKIPLPFFPLLEKLKHQCEELSGSAFNGCLANLYHTGEEGMGYHTDAEPELDPNAPIASLSFGSTRKFSFKHKLSKERVDIWLEPGSLLIMDGASQQHWMHRLPPTKKVHTPRVNLTFRKLL